MPILKSLKHKEKKEIKLIDINRSRLTWDKQETKQGIEREAAMSNKHIEGESYDLRY